MDTTSTYLTVLQSLRNNIRPHLPRLNDVPAVLRVPAHGARPVAFVVAAVDLFGRETETGELAGEEARGVEGKGERRGGVEHCEDNFVWWMVGLGDEVT